MSTVKARLTVEVNRLLSGLPDDLETSGTPEQAAREMLAALPRRSPHDELAGPFHDTAGTRSVLGGISRQAVGQRISQGTILRVVTSDRRNLFPTFQFASGAVRPEVTQVLRTLRSVDDADGWIRAVWFATPSGSLNGMTPREIVTDANAWAGYANALVDLAREAGERWSSPA